MKRKNQLFGLSVWWTCMLSGTVVEYLNFKGAKLSKSRGAFVDVPYFLNKYDPDASRYYLTATAPETRDTEPALRAPKGHPGRISSSATTTSWSPPGATCANAREDSGSCCRSPTSASMG